MRFLSQNGFTLVEMLVVISIIGVLASITAVAIDPFEQFEKAHDAERKNNVTQLAEAMGKYHVEHDNVYPAISQTWIQLYLFGEEYIKKIPDDLGGNTLCDPDTIRQNGYCYNVSGTEMVIYTALNSANETKKCSTTTALFVFSSFDNRSGITCNAANASPAVGSAITFIGE